MLRRVAIFARPDLRESIELARLVYERLRGLGVEAYYDLSIADKAKGPGLDLRFEDVDGVVVIGGDGTLLRLLQLLGEKSPVLHLIRLGHRAFLFPEEPSTAIERLRDFVNGNYWVEEHRRLRVETSTSINYALNEAVLTALGSKIVYLDVFLGDEALYEELAGDGIIVATPLGSTAYSYSAGGPVVHPDMNAIVATPLNPISREMGSTVLPGDRVLEIRVKYTLRPVKLIIDGAKEQLLTRGARIRATLQGPPVRFARYTRGGMLRLPWRRKCSS